MNTKAILTTAAVVAVGGVGYAAYRHFKKQSKLIEDYNIDLQNISIAKWTKAEAVINFTVRFTNKSDIEATLKSMYADVYLNEILVGNVGSTQPAQIPAKGYADISLQLKFSPDVILKNAVDIIIGIVTQKDISYRLKGDAKIGSSFITITKSFEDSGSLKDFVNVPKM